MCSKYIFSLRTISIIVLFMVRNSEFDQKMTLIVSAQQVMGKKIHWNPSLFLAVFPKLPIHIFYPHYSLEIRSSFPRFWLHPQFCEIVYDFFMIGVYQRCFQKPSDFNCFDVHVYLLGTTLKFCYMSLVYLWTSMSGNIIVVDLMTFTFVPDDQVKWGLMLHNPIFF